MILPIGPTTVDMCRLPHVSACMSCCNTVCKITQLGWYADAMTDDLAERPAGRRLGEWVQSGVVLARQGSADDPVHPRAAAPAWGQRDPADGITPYSR